MESNRVVVKAGPGNTPADIILRSQANSQRFYSILEAVLGIMLVHAECMMVLAICNIHALSSSPYDHPPLMNEESWSLAWITLRSMMDMLICLNFLMAVSNNINHGYKRVQYMDYGVFTVVVDLILAAMLYSRTYSIRSHYFWLLIADVVAKIGIMTLLKMLRVRNLKSIEIKTDNKQTPQYVSIWIEKECHYYK